MTDTAKKRLAVLEKLKSVDDATKQEREAQLSLRRKLTKAREEARARSRRAADLDREWRCAQIAARRLELERAQKKLDDVDDARRRARLALELLTEPKDGEARAYRTEAREREDAAREAGRASSLAAGEARRRALRGERAALEGERDALALRRRAVDAKGRLSRARLVEAELKAGDAGDDDAREALERLVLGPSSALPTLPTLSTPSAADDDVEQAMFADVVEGDFTPRVDDVAAPPYPAAAAETMRARYRFDLAVAALELGHVVRHVGLGRQHVPRHVQRLEDLLRPALGPRADDGRLEVPGEALDAARLEGRLQQLVRQALVVEERAVEVEDHRVDADALRRRRRRGCPGACFQLGHLERLRKANIGSTRAASFTRR